MVFNLIINRNCIFKICNHFLENLCKLTEQRYMRRDGLTTSNRGPCKTAPKITSAPENIFNSTDTNVAFSCEGALVFKCYW